MWFRFLMIASLSVAATFGAMMLSVGFILPAATPARVMTVSVWLLAFFLALLFARWAYAKQLPTRRDALLFLALYLMASIVAYLSYGIFLSSRGPWVIVTPEILVQFSVAGIAILLEAYRLRRRQIRASFGEGMTV